MPIYRRQCKLYLSLSIRSDIRVIGIRTFIFVTPGGLLPTYRLFPGDQLSRTSGRYPASGCQKTTQTSDFLLFLARGCARFRQRSLSHLTRIFLSFLHRGWLAARFDRCFGRSSSWQKGRSSGCWWSRYSWRFRMDLESISVPQPRQWCLRRRR